MAPEEAAATPSRKITLKRISHVYYRYADLARAVAFLRDFGFEETKRVGDGKIYFRGYGREPWVICAIASDKDEFGGVGFVVESEDDLRLAAKTLPGAGQIHELEDAPGRGMCVTFREPVDGMPCHLVYGQQEEELLDVPLRNEPFNYPTEKNRPANHFKRFEKRPAPVHKLGHYGHCTTDFNKSFDFWSSNFNFFPSDVVEDANGNPITVFWRLARGKEQVDHHSFFFYEGPKYHVHHTSYETYDFDTQVLGHDWLRERGYENCWGVGRHVLGSQIFDYWFAPSGFIMEHYVDGDVVDESEPTHRSLAGPGSLHVWGPDVPATFLQ